MNRDHDQKSKQELVELEDYYFGADKEQLEDKKPYLGFQRGAVWRFFSTQGLPKSIPLPPLVSFLSYFLGGGAGGHQRGMYMKLFRKCALRT